MISFEHASPEFRLFCGEQSLAQLPRELRRLGCARALVVCGSSVAAGDGLALVMDALGPACAGVFSQVRSHSPLSVVALAARAMADAGADAVVAVGGGSAIVTARAAAILQAEGGDAHALCTRQGPDGKMISPRLQAPKRPQFVVPTTPTTALVKAGSAVLDVDTGQRLALFDPKTRARAVFVHPLLIESAPFELTRAASLNALAMAVEGLESDSSTPLSDAALMQAIRLLAAHLPALEQGPGDADARAHLVLASILCGQGTDQAGGGLASVLGHAVGPRAELANGMVNAIVLPHTMRFNVPATGVRLGKVSHALGGQPRAGDEGNGAIDAIEALLSRLAIPHRLRDAGVARETFPDIAAEAMRDWFVRRNPRRVERPADLIKLLEAAW